MASALHKLALRVGRLTDWDPPMLDRLTGYLFQKSLFKTTLILCVIWFTLSFGRWWFSLYLCYFICILW
jgi:hypothetical protein